MKLKNIPGYSFSPENYMFGLCEEFEGSLDQGADASVTIDLISLMGAKTMRIWMHHKRLFEKDGEGRLKWKQDVFERYRGYVDKLSAAGIRIIAMNHNYVFPDSFSGDKDSVSEFPLPGTKSYLEHLELMREGYFLMAKEFPEIQYWECGNEVNMNFYLAKPGYTAKSIKNSEYIREFCYTNYEKAQITADICYYSNLGVKQGNPHAFTVFPAPTPYRGYAEMAEFYQFVYDNIASGSFPTGLNADNNPDNYFQVQCWHAYNFGGDSSVIQNGGEMIYRIMQDNGDGGKKVFITEFGYHDTDFIKNRGMSREEADKKQAGFFKTDFGVFQNLGFIESVFVFRLYDWHGGPGGEIDFGLFTSPASEKGIVPKAKGLEIFKLFNGKDADTSILYKYFK